MTSMELSVLLNNTMYNEANEFVPVLKAAMDSFSGLFIKQNGELTKRAKETLPNLNKKWQGEDGHWYSISSYVHASEYTAWAKITLCINGESEGKSFCRYYSIEPYMATVKNQQLLNVSTHDLPISLTTVKEQEQAVDAYKKAKDLLKHLEKGICTTVQSSEYIR